MVAALQGSSRVRKQLPLLPLWACPGQLPVWVGAGMVLQGSQVFRHQLTEAHRWSDEVDIALAHYLAEWRRGGFLGIYHNSTWALVSPSGLSDIMRGANSSQTFRGDHFHSFADL